MLPALTFSQIVFSCHVHFAMALATSLMSAVASGSIRSIAARIAKSNTMEWVLAFPLLKKIVENHSGIVTATAAPGKGATIEIIIPSP
jgi:signal transduction histidine kinase